MALSGRDAAVKQLLDSGKDLTKLTREERNLVRDVLRPNKGFTDAQREILSNGWLPVTATQVDAMNALLPVGTQVAGIVDINGDMWVGAHLLTSIEPGDAYEAAGGILSTLPITRKNLRDFPQNPEDSRDDNPVRGS